MNHHLRKNIRDKHLLKKQKSYDKSREEMFNHGTNSKALNSPQASYKQLILFNVCQT